MSHDSATAATPVRPKLSKDGVSGLLDRLPDTVTLEDIQHHLDVVAKTIAFASYVSYPPDA